MKPMDPYAQRLLDLGMAWAEKLWDDAAALVRAPQHEGQHDVRGTVYFAIGLYQKGDAARAERVLRSVLRCQYDRPGTAFHGTFKQTPAEPDPPAEPKLWRDYDPNWREFIGTSFLLILRDLGPSDELRKALWASVRLAAEGTHARDVAPSYTNIALMSAFLLDLAGEHFNEPQWREMAQTKARAIHALFSENNTFWEYNSPTYYGVDLHALELWRKYGLTETFVKLGSEMEAALWRDIGAFYHAGLRNLCGPYDRSYGMDMTRYVALVGLDISLAVPPEKAPLPDLTGPFDHAHDLLNALVAAHMGVNVPDDVLPHLLAFRGERQLTRTIEPGRIATAFLTQNLMLGGETPRADKKPDGQYCNATAHWKLGDGVGWLRVASDQPFCAEVNRQKMLLNCNEVERLEVTFGPDDVAAKVDLQAGSWTLPGLAVSVQPKTLMPTREAEQARHQVAARTGHSQARTVRVSPTREGRGGSRITPMSAPASGLGKSFARAERGLVESDVRPGFWSSKFTATTYQCRRRSPSS